MHCTQHDSLLTTPDVWKKLGRVDRDLAQALERPLALIPALPGRDLTIFSPGDLPAKMGLSFAEGQARMLHDLASIELQALELGFRTLLEFPEAPSGFREELARVTASEAVHLRLCLEALQDLGFPWGTWPVHTALWQSVDVNDSLLDRILIVHRYLEGSGLDAGETLLRRLAGVAEGPAHPVVRQIFREEVEHVEFGSRWYREICRIEKIDPRDDFPKRFAGLRHRVPKRLEKISRELRLQAGFTDEEISFLEQQRTSMQKFSPQKPESALRELPPRGESQSQLAESLASPRTLLCGPHD